MLKDNIKFNFKIKKTHTESAVRYTLVFILAFIVLIKRQQITKITKNNGEKWYFGRVAYGIRL